VIGFGVPLNWVVSPRKGAFKVGKNLFPRKDLPIGLRKVLALYLPSLGKEDYLPGEFD